MQGSAAQPLSKSGKSAFSHLSHATASAFPPRGQRYCQVAKSEVDCNGSDVSSVGKQLAVSRADDGARLAAQNSPHYSTSDPCAGIAFGALTDALQRMHVSNSIFAHQYHVCGGPTRKYGTVSAEHDLERIRDGAQFTVKVLSACSKLFWWMYLLYLTAACSRRANTPQSGWTIHRCWKAGCAVQFYPDQSALDSDLLLHQDAQLRSVLLPVALATSSEGMRKCGPNAFKFPPFSITEAGQSLMEWQSSSTQDLATSMFVLLHIIECVQQMHRAGWVHGSIAPSAFVWRPQTTMWAVTGFNRTARTGASNAITWSDKLCCDWVTSHL